jgi:hypothetical protein
MNARVVLSGLLLVVAAAAAVLSFAALRDLALLCGFAPTLAWLLPVVVDAGAAAGSLVWLGGWAAGPARRFARALALALLGSSVAANALGHGLAAFRLAPAWWVVVIVSAVAPAVLGAVVHLAVLVGRTEPATIPTAAGPLAEDDEPMRHAYEEGLLDEHGLSHHWDQAPCSTSQRPHDPTGDPTSNSSKAPARVPVDGDVRVVELVELLEAGAAVTGAHAAALFGCSPRTGRRLLTRAQALTHTPAPALTPAPTGELVGAGWTR